MRTAAHQYTTVRLGAYIILRKKGEKASDHRIIWSEKPCLHPNTPKSEHSTRGSKFGRLHAAERAKTYLCVAPLSLLTVAYHVVRIDCGESHTTIDHPQATYHHVTHMEQKPGEKTGGRWSGWEIGTNCWVYTP